MDDDAINARDEYVAQCKKRALAYLERGDVMNAVTSMLSDMDKRPDTKVNGFVASLGMSVAGGYDVNAARRYIEGFH